MSYFLLDVNCWTASVLDKGYIKMIDNILRMIYIHIEELKDETTKDLCRKIKSRISKTLVKYFLSYQSMFCMPL